MATPLTSITNREVQNEYIQRRFLEFLKPQLQFFKFAQEGDVPQGVGDFIRWLDFPKMTVDVTALSESTPTDNEMTSYAAVAVSGSIKAYGQWLSVSEQQAKTAVVGTLDAISERLSELGARTVDTLLKDACATGTKYFKEGQVASATGFCVSTSTLTASTFTYINAELQALGVGGHSNIGGQYAAVLSPVQIAELQAQPAGSTNVVTWSEVNKYNAGTAGKHMSADAGSLFNVALHATPLITKAGFLETSGTNGAGTTLSGYKGFVIGKDAIGRAGIGDMQPEIIVKKPGGQDTSQPLNTYWTYGVKFRAAHELLDDDRIMQVHSV
jgi:N4-gp56 family major capsid protein